MIFAFYSHLAVGRGPAGGNCFSQWYRSEFQEGAERFVSAEQYMMYHKARLFGDGVRARDILAARTPFAAMELGRQVEGFAEDGWDAAKYEIVLRGNWLKFIQNPGAGDVLRGTGEAVIVFAAANDLAWGTGWSLLEHSRRSESDWPGENLLGKALMHVRRLLRDADGGAACLAGRVR